MAFKRVQRVSKPEHTPGVAILVPHTRFTPTPDMPDHKIAFEKGAEAKRLGRPINDNPHRGKSKSLSATWDRGYKS